MKRRIWIKLAAWILAFVIIIAVADIILKSVVEKKLRTSLQQFQPYIQSGFSKAHVNLFKASVQIDSLYILYNPEMNERHQHKIFFSHADISGINFFKLLAGKNFSAASLKLSDANIKLDNYLLDKNNRLPANIFKNIQLPFDNISFSAVEVLNAKISEQYKNKISPLCTAKIFLNDVAIPHIDSSFTKNSIHFSNVICDLNNVNYNLPGYYSVSLKAFHISSKDSVMQLDSLKLIPQLGKFQLGENLGQQADHVTAFVNNIKVSGLDVKDMMQKKFVAREINISKSNAYVFRDRRLPRSKKEQPMPLDYLKQIPFEMQVQRFSLNDANITSEEFPKDGVHSGFIKLEHISITMMPFTNQVQGNTAFISSNVKASIMGAGNIHAVIDLSMKDGSSQIKGAIDNLNLPALNPSAENLGKFHIQSGVLNRLDFEFTATNTKATGQIVGVYHDLIIDRLKITKDGLKTAWLSSFALHHFIIPKNKDASLDIKKRTGKIDYVRDPTRLVTFYYLKALLDGIRDSFSLGFLLPE